MYEYSLGTVTLILSTHSIMYKIMVIIVMTSDEFGFRLLPAPFFQP